MVFTALAPMASRVSTTMCVTTIGPPWAAMTRTSRSRNPPPRRTSIGSHPSHRAATSALRSRMRMRAFSGSGTPTSWIWAIMSVPDTEVVKPPAS